MQPCRGDLLVPPRGSRQAQSRRPPPARARRLAARRHLAQRAKNRPNRLGLTVCKILEVKGFTVRVEGLDAIDGTPVLDLKPWMEGFAPRGEVREPDWAKELMAGYW
ncbi:MAG TPA: TrmO family methyltransferase [Hyphomonadaceae bacterium]|nr:TrmO family methyltransferase [Hyphomonadaceae bacterium]